MTIAINGSAFVIVYDLSGCCQRGTADELFLTNEGVKSLLLKIAEMGRRGYVFDKFIESELEEGLLTCIFYEGTDQFNERVSI